MTTLSSLHITDDDDDDIRNPFTHYGLESTAISEMLSPVVLNNSTPRHHRQSRRQLILISAETAVLSGASY